MERSRFISVACAVGATALLYAAAGASTVSRTYRFDGPLVTRSQDGFSRILFERTIQAGRAGGPSYPFRGVALLLPPGETVAGVRLERRGWRTIAGEHLLYPRQHPVPGIERDEGRRRLLVDESLYGEDSRIDPPLSPFSTQTLCGHSIAVGSFSPVTYHPARREAGFYSEVTVVVETAPAGGGESPLRLLRTDGATRGRLGRIVDNPEALSWYRGLEGDGPADAYELLIVTRDSLASAFQPLEAFYERRGMRTVIRTVEEILSSYSGTDDAERLRNAVIDEYTSHGITHLLLGGDGDIAAPVVPRRGLYGQVVSSTLYTDAAIPADLYFAALDGDWNGDGDSYWGEEGEEDFYSEIAVGRACVDDAAETAVFIDKTTSYQDSPIPGDMRKALLLGEHLYSDPLTYGGDEMDQLVGTCTAYGFTTTGIPVGFDTTTYYDRDLGSWSKSVVWTEFNAGAHWVAHSGHANSGYVMRLFSSDITTANFTNDGVSAGFPLVYTYGCLAGAFDSDDCIGEKMVSIPTCAGAFLGNSRYGWFTEGTTNGPSHHFQREFFDAVFTEGITTLGAANQRSKDETVPFVDLPDEYEPGAHRWVFYCLNLLGDPALDSWTDTPGTLAVTHPVSVARGDTVIAVEAGVAGAVGSLYRDGTVLGRGTADRTGHIDIAITTALPDTIETIELNVWAHDRYVYRDTLNVVDSWLTFAAAPATPATLRQNAPNPFNPSTVIEFTLRARMHASLRVYDVSGREVGRLVEGTLEAGPHRIVWTPGRLASGVYFYVLRAGRTTLTRKAVLLR